MTLNSQRDREYRDSAPLKTVHLSHLRIRHLRIEPAHHEPGLYESTELGVIISGRSLARLTANGSSHRNLIQPGVACILPAGLFLKDISNTSPVEAVHFYLPRTLISRSAMADYDIDPAKAELSFIGGLRDPMLHQIAMNFFSVMGREVEPTDRLFLDGMQAALAGHLLGKYAIDRWRPRARTPEFDAKGLKRVLDYIESHFATHIGLCDLAAEARLSEFHFARLFRKATGLSPHRYVTSRRVQEAQKLLELNRFSLVEIALEAGFGSQANFIRVFRKATGLTPGQYRELCSR